MVWKDQENYLNWNNSSSHGKKNVIRPMNGSVPNMRAFCRIAGRKYGRYDFSQMRLATGDSLLTWHGECLRNCNESKMQRMVVHRMRGDQERGVKLEARRRWGEMIWPPLLIHQQAVVIVQGYWRLSDDISFSWPKLHSFWWAEKKYLLLGWFLQSHFTSYTEEERK